MPRPLQVVLLTLKVVYESRVTWATSVPIFLVFLGLSVPDSDWGCFRGCAISSSLGAPF